MQNSADITEGKPKKKHSKIICFILFIFIILLIILDIIAGNYLVSFAIARKASDSSSVAPEPVTSSEADAITEANIRLLSEKTKSWLKHIVRQETEIISDDGLTLKGDIIINDEDNHLWSIVVHGYTARRIYMYDYACAYAEQGYHVLLPDMRAHGDSEGKYIGMGWLDRKDVLNWIDLIRSMDSQAQIVLHGVSMGGATVLMTSGEHLPENVKAVIDDCGYTSVWDIFSDELEYLFGLPDFPFLYTASSIARIRAGYTFQEASAIAQVKKACVPIMFIHGSEDNFVHTEMAYELYEACSTEKELYICEGAGHGLSLYMNPDVYFGKVFSFLSKVSVS